ncbi:MAG: hypothetical protein ACTSQJ_16370 [Promethearchaeota archaeon]
MARYYLYILNGINAVVFLWLLFVFNSVFNFEKVITTGDNELVVFDVINAIKNIIIYSFYLLLYIVGYFSALGTAGIFSGFPYYNGAYMFYFMGFLIKNYLSLWFAFPNGVAPDLEAVPALIGAELLVFTTDIYLLTFQVLFMFAIIYFIFAIFRYDPRYNLVVVGCLVLMIVIPLMIKGFDDMLKLFTITIPYLDSLKNPLSAELTELPIDDFWGFFGSPVALLAIIMYIYLELAFQIDYTNIVTKPSLERNERLEAQLKILQKESLVITANIDKIKEEAKARLEEMKLTEKETIGKFFTQKGEQFSYITEMIKRKKLEEEEKKLIMAASKTRRLGRYIERLFREDDEARDTITAKSAAPKPKKLATSTAITFSFRVGMLIIISYIIIHPQWFFENIFNLPPAITESVVMFSPEVIIILLLPIMLIFPVISYTISYIKHRNLILRLRQEGRIKEILASVGDYVKITKEEEEKEEEEGTQEEIASATTA